MTALSVTTTYVFFLLCVVCSARIASIHIFCIQKDEERALLNWVNHHSRIVGNSNVHLIDNDSTDPAVKSTLKEIAASGVDIIKSKAAFPDKHKILTSVMKKYNTRGNVLIPLDIDEFIVATSPDQTFSIDKDLIFKTLQNLPHDGHNRFKFKGLEAINCNVTTSGPFLSRANYFRHKNFGCDDKSFYLGGSFVSTDQGNHKGKTYPSPRICSGKPLPTKEKCSLCFNLDNGLGIVHFGTDVLSSKEIMAKYQARLKAYGYTEKAAKYSQPHECGNIHGKHYCEYVVSHRNDPEDFPDRLVDIQNNCLVSTDLFHFDGFVAESHVKQVAINPHYNYTDTTGTREERGWFSRWNNLWDGW